MGSTTNNFTLFPNCIGGKKNVDVIDVAKCCIEKCNNNYELCDKYCSGNIDCKNNCISVNKNLCRDICQLASNNLQIENDFYDCATKNGCMKNMKMPTLECVKNNTENIDNCVRSKWLPNKADLDKYNKFFNELPFNEKQLIKNSSGGESKNITYKDNTLKYIVVGIFISIILSIIIITI